MAAFLRYVLPTAVMLLAGCAADASGPQFSTVEVSGGRGTIYVYALGGFAGYGQSPIIEVDGHEVGKLQPKGFLAVNVTSGAHRVVMKSVLAVVPLPGLPISVSVREGGTAYMRVDRKYDGLAFSPGGGAMPIYVNVMAQVPAETGAREIRSTRASVG